MLNQTVANQIAKPPDRGALTRALTVNALTKPVNVAVGVAVLVAAIVIGVSWLFIVAAGVYGVLALMTFFDGDEAERVGNRVYGKAREIDEKGRIKPTDLSGPIGAQLQAAQSEEQRIRASIDGADLPFDEVSSEVDALVRSMERVCHRADLVYRYLEGQNPNQVRWRLQQVQQEAGNAPDPSQKQLIEALQQQLEALGGLEDQLRRFYSQMEHTVTSLGAIGARIVQASVAEE